MRAVGLRSHGPAPLHALCIDGGRPGKTNMFTHRLAIKRRRGYRLSPSYTTQMYPENALMLHRREANPRHIFFSILRRIELRAPVAQFLIKALPLIETVISIRSACERID
ncbi:hypothetical protein EVAR_97720_1 [Eumeta japonica]|uniref:Uncharacterized protein n=1 Tax=Eumeta variegata TaxID=151549 RepID=A0A4C1Y081_EUMVA|nr:hypothetical protein EVAR_97720_1 [Eumeta japonica]